VTASTAPIQPADETRLATFTVTLHRARDDQGVKFWRVSVGATVYTYIAWDSANPAGALAEDAVAHAVRDHLLGVVSR
jgi:hypothetical protein